MPTSTPTTSLSITNPLVLYRALVATKKIKPDPAQHRLALQLQKLYFRLKDYSPELEFRHRLDQISRNLSQNVSKQRTPRSESASLKPISMGVLASFFKDASGRSKLALTKTIPIHDSALKIDSPQGMLLYGEVGRGKSMLLDLLYDSLPSRKKRRWHFNTFMLDVFRRLEQERVRRAAAPDFDHEHVVLSLAKDTIGVSPILFLDEFQMPDRTSSKLLNSFMTAFFHLGGVLVASSNRMPDELAKASGIEFGGSRHQRGRGIFGWSIARISEGQRAAQTDFGQFLEILKARCEVWEMEGEKDWRRDDFENDAALDDNLAEHEDIDITDTNSKIPKSEVPFSNSTSALDNIKDDIRSSDSPPHYHVTLPDENTSSFDLDLIRLNPSEVWIPATIKVYGRTIQLPKTHDAIALCPFPLLCSSLLGPADYVTLCSTFHTLILSDIPVLHLQQKNEARRFITLLDALYESRCRLLIQAAAPPDKLFFPETGVRRRASSPDDLQLLNEHSDSIASEAFSEIYQDSTAPFRPNVSTYDGRTSILTPAEFSHPSSSILADEDADFGPTYGSGRSYGASVDKYTELPASTSGFDELERRQGPDFTDTSALTGHDERFAFRRARSRLWEMCGKKWWKQRQDEDVETWWRPVKRGERFWEITEIDGQDEMEDVKRTGKEKEDSLFRHGASPFRTRSDPPPKFGSQHSWGMMKWGKKAGEWGKGVEGDRNKDR